MPARIARANAGMSRSGNVWDNAAAMESFFSSLKPSGSRARHARARNHAKAGIFYYMECFYNPMLRHSTLNYVSRMNFGRQAQVA